MARYQEDHRETLQFLAASLDRLLPEDSVARAIRAGLDPLDFSAYDALYANDAVGRPAVDPRCLAGVWTLALLRGITSSVRLADLCGRDVEFRWLLGMVESVEPFTGRVSTVLKPHPITICFRADTSRRDKKQGHVQHQPSGQLSRISRVAVHSQYRS